MGTADLGPAPKVEFGSPEVAKVGLYEPIAELGAAAGHRFWQPDAE